MIAAVDCQKAAVQGSQGNNKELQSSFEMRPAKPGQTGQRQKAQGPGRTRLEISWLGVGTVENVWRGWRMLGY